ncbi:protein DENND6A isoform X2 [Macrosteles quadrilineatus]|uniref:protein DENND6A isoform X2 n=1 Tax=Macrosteles quadrilineatus TaxID=74068 RepID=UPI0023E0C3C9|nr:protein DENND6A isoform X2 [Macrosteles quadrilineatus]
MASEQKKERSVNEDHGGCSGTSTYDRRKQNQNEGGQQSSDTNPAPWDRFSNWIHCICIVTFDLELGQAIEVIYPVDAQLQEEDKTNICYLAFPDSNSSCMGDTKFHIRIRQTPGGPDLLPVHLLYNQKCPVYLQVDNGYFYGYVYFRQVKDITLPRGYFQKSVILISRFPFINLFSELVSLIAPEFFDNGCESVEAACHDIDQWPAPTPGDTLNLPILGTVLQVQVPCDSGRGGSSSSLVPSGGNVTLISSPQMPTVLPSVYEVNTFDVFSTVLYHMHLLWELVLTAEPIVVMASSPATSAQMVQALVSMITPLMYYADYRPYFTIHDSEFREYTTRTQAPPPIILGVTNPFFAKTLQHWPHIIKVPDSFNGSNFQKHKIRKGNHLKMLDTKPGVYTQYQPFLQKDKTILKKIMKGVQTKRPGEVQSALLRRHLLELTQSFMIPLERYMGTLMPLQKNISPYKAAPQPWPFNPDDFIASLETSGPQLTSGIKGDWVGLYRRFFRSPNFSGWYNARYKGMNQKLQILQLEALSDADVSRRRRWWQFIICSLG